MTLLNCEQFESRAHDLGPCELIDGKVVPLTPGGFLHNQVTGNIYALLRDFARTHGLGRVVTNEIGIVLSTQPPTCRGADVAFLSFARLPRAVRPAGFLTVPPELIVEVLGESAGRASLMTKIAAYHRFGVDRVWIVDPVVMTVEVHPGRGSMLIFTERDRIGDPALPGFNCPVAQFFEDC